MANKHFRVILKKGSTPEITGTRYQLSDEQAEKLSAFMNNQGNFYELLRELAEADAEAHGYSIDDFSLLDKEDLEEDDTTFDPNPNHNVGVNTHNKPNVNNKPISGTSDNGTKSSKSADYLTELAKYKSRQGVIFANKLMHGFNTTDASIEVRHILEEVVELMKGIEHHDLENITEEISDIVIYCYGLAGLFGVNLDDAIFKKMEINAHRKYIRTPDGDFIKQE